MKKLNYLFIVCLLFTFNSPILGQTNNNGNGELFLMPTAEMMPKGSHFLTSYEILILKYTYALTDSTQVGIIMPFPVVADMFEYSTFHLKQRYINTTSFKSAAWITYTAKESFYSIGNVFTLNLNKSHINLGLSMSNLFDGNNSEFIVMAGLRQEISPKVSIIAEYTNFQTLIEENFAGIITFGARIHLKKWSLDLGLIRPLEFESDYLFFPYLKVSYMFK